MRSRSVYRGSDCKPSQESKAGRQEGRANSAAVGNDGIEGGVANSDPKGKLSKEEAFREWAELEHRGRKTRGRGRAGGEACYLGCREETVGEAGKDVWGSIMGDIQCPGYQCLHSAGNAGPLWVLEDESGVMKLTA